MHRKKEKKEKETGCAIGASANRCVGRLYRTQRQQPEREREREQSYPLDG